MMGDSRSHGLWEASAPAAVSAVPLTGHIAVDAVIVGGGFTGLSAALHLAEAGASVAVLEAFEIGFGASGRNVGLVNAGMWMMPSLVSEKLGKIYGERLLDALGQAPAVVFELVERHGMDCQAVHEGTLHCAVGVSGLRQITERARQWRERGAPVELLDAARTRLMVGSGAYSGALLDKRAGTIQPLAYARGLAAAAVAAGAMVHTQTAVVDARHDADGWQLHTLSGGSVAARWVIVATNAYGADATGMGAQVGSELARLPYFNMATEPLGKALADSILPGRQGAWDTRKILSSFRKDREGRLVFGSVGALRGPGNRVHPDWGRRALLRLFPQLGPVAFTHQWYGWIEVTANSLPRFHKLGTNMVSFSGYNGRGIAPGTVFGRELAKLVLGRISEGDLPLPVTVVKPMAWRGIREAGYELGAQVSHFLGARL